MYTDLASFLKDWRRESELTARLMDALTDESLLQRVSEQDRTLGRMAWHTVTTISEMLGQVGLCVSVFGESGAVPTSAAAIAAAYRAVSSAVAEAIESEWSDDSLHVMDAMYGETWPRGMTLDVLIRHEIHHRGQMTVLMRQAGLAVPGVYGPSREEWAKLGMEPPSV